MGPSHATWSVTTWNTHGSARPDPHALADAIRSLATDVVAVQEIQRHQARQTARLLGWHHVWARKHYPYSPVVWWRAEGLAILSRHPLTDRRAWEISRGWSTWTYRHRIMLAATATRPDGTALRVYDVHFSSDDRPDETIEQADRAAVYVAADRSTAPQSARVVAGDFNDEGLVETVRAFHPLGLRDHGSLPANPAVAPVRRIDHVLIPEEAQPVEEHVPDIGVAPVPGGPLGWPDLSDHLPVTLRFPHPSRSGS